MFSVLTRSRIPSVVQYEMYDTVKFHMCIFFPPSTGATYWKFTDTRFRAPDLSFLCRMIEPRVGPGVGRIALEFLGTKPSLTLIQRMQENWERMGIE